MSYLISIICPIYNREELLKPTINSLIDQSIGFENLELVLVDDLSTDNTRNILKKYETEFENINVIYLTENKGQGNARNVGVKNSKSKYVMFIDHDDTFDSTYCEDMYNAIVKYDTDIATSRLKYVHPNGDIITRKDNLSKINEEFILLDPKEEDTIFNDPFIWNKIYKKEFLLNNNIEFPFRYFEDVYFNICSFLSTDNVVFLNDCHGYNHFMREWGEDTPTIDVLFNDFDYFTELCLLFNENQRFYLEKFFYCHIIDFLIHFVNQDMSHECKIKFLNLVYELETKYGFDGKLNQYWAEILNKNIRKKNFERTIFLSKIIRFIQNFKFARKIYLKLYKGE